MITIEKKNKNIFPPNKIVGYIIISFIFFVILELQVNNGIHKKIDRFEYIAKEIYKDTSYKYTRFKPLDDKNNIGIFGERIIDYDKLNSDLSKNNDYSIAVKEKYKYNKYRYINEIIIFISIIIISLLCLLLLYRMFYFLHINNKGTPFQRIGFVLLLISIIVFFIFWYLIGFEATIRHIKFDITNGRYGWIFYTSLGLLIISIILLSNFAEKFITWIKFGKQ